MGGKSIPHKLIGWANYFLLKCWGKNRDVMLPFKQWDKCPILSIHASGNFLVPLNRALFGLHAELCLNWGWTELQGIEQEDLPSLKVSSKCLLCSSEVLSSCYHFFIVSAASLSSNSRAMVTITSPFLPQSLHPPHQQAFPGFLSDFMILFLMCALY